MKYAAFVALLFCGWPVRGECSPKHERYLFGYDGHTARLWDSHAKRFLWRRAMSGVSECTWSDDHRALAVEGNLVDGNRPCVLVWREGFRAREFAVFGDYSMGVLWSPDKRRLLVRYGISGDVDVDVGTLYCLELKPWPRYRCYKLGVAHKLQWNDSRMVTYWDVEYRETSLGLGDKHVWHVPSRSHRSGR